MLKKFHEIEDGAKDKISNWYNNLNPKNKRLIRYLPARIVILIVVLSFNSAINYQYGIPDPVDEMFFYLTTIILCIFIFFVPLDKLITK